MMSFAQWQLMKGAAAPAAPAGAGDRRRARRERKRRQRQQQNYSSISSSSLQSFYSPAAAPAFQLEPPQRLPLLPPPFSPLSVVSLLSFLSRAAATAGEGGMLETGLGGETGETAQCTVVVVYAAAARAKVTCTVSVPYTCRAVVPFLQSPPSWVVAWITFLVQELTQHLARMLDEDEREALLDYTRDKYVAMNHLLRKGRFMDVGEAGADFSPLESQYLRIERCRCALSKMRPFVGTVYRGTGLPTEVAEALRPGATYADPGFLSSSTDRTKAFKRDYLFIIESRTGVDIQDLSAMKHEAEVLFRPGILFEVLSVDRVGDWETIVTMREV